MKSIYEVMSIKTFYSLTKKERRLVSLLSDGGKYSAISIANRLLIGDPRANIRDLRKKGINVVDEWVSNSDKSGFYKLYFIR